VAARRCMGAGRGDEEGEGEGEVKVEGGRGHYMID
jgi:hypothetical protein